MKNKLLAHKWEGKLKELKNTRINETNFSIKNMLADKELLIEEFLQDIKEE